MEKLNAVELAKLAKEALDVDVSVVMAEPVFVGAVALTKFKRSGSLLVFRDADGIHFALPVPTGLEWLQKYSKAA
jgi:hypothetical protein